ncbi:DUF4272 domain-containing protein [Variovorax boronicumulans]|uniref:DUF4272 domain-containing protein n=1 Tax=Variovorax boronicumulans TaxID=436515 RepID=UPI0027D815EF|nr:DUF4272 domain-containing protein [Variovorax boronicumulans]
MSALPGYDSGHEGDPHFSRWWDRQNDRDAFKKGMAEFSKLCRAAVVHHVPDARRVRARAIWYGDQTRARILWVDGMGRKWQWHLFLPFSVSLKKPSERDIIIERSLQNLLNPPQVNDWDELAYRTAEQVAQRLLALIAVVWRANASEELAQQGIAWAKKHGIDTFLSPLERRFVFHAQRPEQQDIVNFGWRAEAMIPLVWALGGMPALPPSHQRGDIWKIPLVQQARESPADLIAGARLRPDNVVGDEEIRLLNEHWHVVDAQLRGQAVRADLDAGVVMERRYALSWMIGYGESWDEVPLDT